MIFVAVLAASYLGIPPVGTAETRDRTVRSDVTIYLLPNFFDNEAMGGYLSVDRAYADAPAPLHEMALSIMLGKTPSPDALEALGDDVSKPFDTPNSRLGTNLLTVTYQAKNFEALDVLLAAGADPSRRLNPANGDGPGVDFTSVISSFVYFPMPVRNPDGTTGDWDYGPGSEAIRLYLKHGGNPDHRPEGGTNTLLGSAMLSGNLKAVKLLLDFGGNPFAQAAPGTGDSPVALAQAGALDEESLGMFEHMADMGLFSAREHAGDARRILERQLGSVTSAIKLDAVEMGKDARERLLRLVRKMALQMRVEPEDVSPEYRQALAAAMASGE